VRHGASSCHEGRRARTRRESVHRGGRHRSPARGRREAVWRYGPRARRAWAPRSASAPAPAGRRPRRSTDRCVPHSSRPPVGNHPARQGTSAVFPHDCRDVYGCRHPRRSVRAARTPRGQPSQDTSVSSWCQMAMGGQCSCNPAKPAKRATRAVSAGLSVWEALCGKLHPASVPPQHRCGASSRGRSWWHPFVALTCGWRAAAQSEMCLSRCVGAIAVPVDPHVHEM
jgi:hypothetical protein